MTRLFAQTMNMLTEKYASFVQQASFERNGEHEKNIEDVVEKCLDILQTQVLRSNHYCGYLFCIDLF